MIFKVYFVVLLACTFIHAGPVRIKQPSSRAISVFDDADTHVIENLEDLQSNTSTKDANSDKEVSNEFQTGFPILPGFNDQMTEAPHPENTNKNDIAVSEENTKPNVNPDVNRVPVQESQNPQINNTANSEDDEDGEDFDFDFDWGGSEDEPQEQGPVSGILNEIADVVEQYIQSAVKVGEDIFGSEKDDNNGDSDYTLL
ncbi:uncharacterized protein LOC107037860 [Diachasma alloeum]|uniref:uncharacterized protein LOC107037860 n=1 Tax=Diachasma alloeum TaxID=454923 RepID=UPI0007381D0B|nr:uncharacterized protein LOC107037860 [Diachasma alloeum]XP_015112124.1 uncharacterized protein LOC107037860 [Diachasma alloeum]